MVTPKSYAALFYFLIMGAAVMSGLGLIAGALIQRWEYLAAVYSFVVTPLTYLAGIFYNPNNEVTSSWAHFLVKIDPLFHIIDGFRYGFIAHANYNLTFGIWFVAFCSITINLLGYSLFKRGTGFST